MFERSSGGFLTSELVGQRRHLSRPGRGRRCRARRRQRRLARSSARPATESSSRSPRIRSAAWLAPTWRRQSPRPCRGRPHHQLRSVAGRPRIGLPRELQFLRRALLRRRRDDEPVEPLRPAAGDPGHAARRPLRLVGGQPLRVEPRTDALHRRPGSLVGARAGRELHGADDQGTNLSMHGPGRYSAGPSRFGRRAHRHDGGGQWRHHRGRRNRHRRQPHPRRRPARQHRHPRRRARRSSGRRARSSPASSTATPTVPTAPTTSCRNRIGRSTPISRSASPPPTIRRAPPSEVFAAGEMQRAGIILAPAHLFVGRDRLRRAQLQVATPRSTPTRTRSTTSAGCRAKARSRSRITTSRDATSARWWPPRAGTGHHGGAGGRLAVRHGHRPDPGWQHHRRAQHPAGAPLRRCRGICGRRPRSPTIRPWW